MRATLVSMGRIRSIERRRILRRSYWEVPEATTTGGGCSLDEAIVIRTRRQLSLATSTSTSQIDKGKDKTSGDATPRTGVEEHDSNSNSNSNSENDNIILLHEVTPRDGLQNEKSSLEVPQKLELVRLLVQSRPNSVELTSFVREDLVPRMKGGMDLCLRLNEEEWAWTAKKRHGMHFAGLVPNQKGYEKFQQARGPSANASLNSAILDTVVCLTSCTDSHSQANVRRPMKEALNNTLEIIKMAKDDGMRVQAYASLAFGCPFEGTVDPAVVYDIVQAYRDAGVDRIMLADTLGVATPEQVSELIRRCVDQGKVPEDRLGLHMHDSHGRARENLWVGVKEGVKFYDAAIGGCGGCNFAPGAKGNISTQAALEVFDKVGGSTSIYREKLHEATTYLQSCLGRELEFEPPHLDY